MRLTSPVGLRATNAVVGLVHLLQAIAVVWLANDFAVPVTAAFLDGPPGSPAGDTVTMFEVRFGWAIAAFLLLAAVDHLLMAAPGVNRWYEGRLGRRINPARWAEYSVSATIMVLLIAMLTGITEVFALVGIAGANVAMILFGHRMERVNDGSRPVDWQPFWFGCLAGIVPWIAITIAIVGAEVEYGGVPTFVFAIFVSLFVLFNSFAVNQVLQYRELGPWRSYRFGELGYLVLSLTAKSALAWQVFGGALAG